MGEYLNVYLPCAAHGHIDGMVYQAQCPNFAQFKRYVIADGYALSVSLCSEHRRLWDHDYGRVAVGLGEPGGESSPPR